ncbi:MAG: hypothetical protein JSV53_06200 [candidate division WOR-3 bacterium]|nr:MAG: hypothetical protein JSV53_06200 [candidate division WOR-3 bacterium]
MIVFILFLQILPEHELMVYATDDKGKIGSIDVVSNLDSLGYHVVYTSDRIIEIRLDSLNLGTVYVKKVVGGETELLVERNEDFDVYFKGRECRHREKSVVYDRHTLDFALRGFDYEFGYKSRFRLHIPEFMIVNADLEVQGETVVDTPAGIFDCWVVRMKPRILFFNKQFFFYIEKEYPHRFVKYSDASGENSILLKYYEASSHD